MSDDVYISYTDNGFLHSFSAAKDGNGDWSVHFLVMQVNDRSKVYLGEYTKFRKQVLNRLKALGLLDQRQIRDQIDNVYIKVIQAFLMKYIARIHVNLQEGVNLYEYGQETISKLQEIIDAFDIDMRVTRIYQPGKVAFYFTWDGNIVASYYINKNNNTDYLDTTIK